MSRFRTCCLFLVFAFPAFAKLNPPKQYAPADKSTNRSTTSYFYVNGVAGATWYEFEFADNSGMKGAIRLKSDYSSTSVGYVYGIPIRMNTTYYWRSRSMKTGDSSDWTALWTFTTDTNITTRSPGNNTGPYMPSMVFSWDRSFNFSKYLLQLDTANTFNTARFKEYRIDDTSSTWYIEFLEKTARFNRTYYWRICGISATDSLRWTSVNKFTTVDSVRIFQPATGIQETPTNVQVNFSRDRNITYYLELDTTSNFGSHKRRKYLIERGNQDYFYFKNLEFDQTYYWRIRAFAYSDTSRWNKTRYFTVAGMKNKRYVNTGSTIPTTNSFSWNPVDTALWYQFQADYVPSFNSKNLRDTFITMDLKKNPNPQCQVTYKQFPYGQTLYLRARPIHQTDTGDWSRTETTVVYAKSTPYYPNNNTTNIPILVNHTFQSFAGQTNYRIQRDEVPTFNSPALIDTFGTTVLPHMKYNTVYYWRIMVMHESDTSQWSTVNKFTTVKAPVLKAPYSTKIFGPGLSGKLEWEKMTSHHTFEVQLDTQAGFASPVLLRSFLPADTLSLSFRELYFGKVYHWRVRAISVADTSDWSPVWNFYTYNPVVLSWPGNKQTGISFSSLDWNSINGTTGYHYMLSSDSLFTNAWEGIHEKDNSFFHYFSPNPTEFNTRYFWKVRVFHARDTSDWSEVWSFTTRKRNGVILTYPPDKEMNVPPGLLLTWKSVTDAVTYEMEYSESADLSSPGKYSASLPAYQLSLKPSTDYYWHVRALNKDGVTLTDFSEVFKFTTASNFVAPGLVSPANRSAGHGSSIGFTWTSVRGATYDMQFSNDSLFQQAVMNATSNTSLTVNGFINHKTYYWRVRAKNTFVTGPWSNFYTFNTGTGASVSSLQRNSVVIYPNPARQTFFAESNDGSPIRMITLKSPHGQILYRDQDIHKESVHVSIDFLPVQLYIVEVLTDKGIQSFKLIKE